jgi:menaquinone-9 beta-reductase
MDDQASGIAASYDVVCVGGGIGGSGLATVLARRGLRCLVLESTETFPDRTKGEWIAGWGVLDARRIGLEDDLRTARGHSPVRHITYDEGRSAADSERDVLTLAAIMPGLPGPLTQRHPDACQVLFNAAATAGATVLRPVSDVCVRAGDHPQVSFTHGDRTQIVTCRLVVGADGRNSRVRQQIGLELQRDTPHHLFSGLLVDDAVQWPEDLEVTGTEGDVHYLAFPQGQGRVRLYLGWELTDRHRFSGAGGPQRFVDTFARLTTLPGASALGAATPISPCATYANEDTWIDVPLAPGVVLLGDAAGWNDPITGQGLAITMRDVRVLSELLLAGSDWSLAALMPYAEERHERMRRLRFAAHLTSVLNNEFGAAACERRQRARERVVAEPALGMTRAIVMIGPEVPGPEAFTDERWAAIAG